jgi:hypothetical protein
MNTQQLLTSMTDASSNVPRLTPLLAGAMALFGRRRRRPRSRIGLLGGGALLAAAGAFLFGTERGRALRTRLGKQVGGQLGKVVGAQIGGHPVRAAGLAQNARHLVSPRGM